MIAWIALIAGVSAGVWALGTQPWIALAKATLPKYVVKETHTFSVGTVRVSTPRWSDEGPMDLAEVLLGGEVHFRISLLHPTVGEVRLYDHPEEQPESGPFLDHLWITENTGGSGGHTTTYLFSELDGSLFPVATLVNGTFVDGRWVQSDTTYRYWLTSGAGSPTPILRGIPGEGGLAWLDPTPDDGPSQAELDEHRRRIRAATPAAQSADEYLSPALRGFLDLVYAGRAPDAWVFLDECFDAGLQRFLESDAVSDLPRSRESFRSALVEKVRTSPYYGELLRRNNGSIRPPER